MQTLEQIFDDMAARHWSYQVSSGYAYPNTVNISVTGRSHGLEIKSETTIDTRTTKVSEGVRQCYNRLVATATSGAREVLTAPVESEVVEYKPDNIPF